MSWVPLHVHSQYSILDASAPIKKIAEKAKAYNMPAVALTDHGNLFGAVEFYKACHELSVKPILGCEFYVAPRSRLHKNREPGLPSSYHLVLLAKNQKGYQNLCKLSSHGYLEGFYYNPRIDEELLFAHSEGIICLSGCIKGLVAQQIIGGDLNLALSTIKRYHGVFGDDYFLELQRHPMTEEQMQAAGFTQEPWLLQQHQSFREKQEKVIAALASFSKQEDVPLVATNDSHYMNPEEWRAHEILLNIQSGEPCQIWEKDSAGNPKFRVPNPKRETYSSYSYYFKSPEEMEQLFHDYPEALQSTLEIAERCDVSLDFKSKHYPVYIPPAIENRAFTDEERKKSVEEYLWQLCEEGIPKRYTPERLAKIKELYPDQEPLQVVRDRLAMEMDVIAPKDMCDYLLIVWDFINWAKLQGIPVGPGRGSGAGSIVLYLIGVTDIEPLRFHLFFERFINPERISYPDIDVDICMDRRGEVINYTLNKYGRDNVAQIITFGTMKAKMAVKDVGRALNVPLAKVNSIAKLIPEDLTITIEKALEKDYELRNMYEQDEEVHQLIDIAIKLEGSIRNTGIHAAGIIVSGAPLTDLIPVCVAKDSEMPVTQFSMKPVEMVGMLKIDFLGLKTLTAVVNCVDSIAAAGGKKIDWSDLPLDDAPTFQLLNQGKTLGVFQLESGGMQDLARQLHLDKFEEIIAVGALYRPGPMDMIPSFINRKHGKEEIENDHPWMKDILSETYGIMVYQEQVMQIASRLANYSLGEGDVLRRAMGKKDSAQMAKEREKFKQGALQNQIEESVSMRIFDKMEKFAAYGFNKSHAAAYGYLSYVTAYLKANYPKEWMAALMTCDCADLTKVAKFIGEAQAMGIPILPPDVNEAGSSFVATSEGIRFAMSGVKGVGTGVVEAIIAERRRKGPYKSLYDFFRRLDHAKVGKKVVENLIDAGAFDFTGWSRDSLRESVEPMADAASKARKEEASGVLTLFAKIGQSDEQRFSSPPEPKFPRLKIDALMKEKELLGFFLTGHPMDSFKSVLQRISCFPLSRVDELAHEAVFRSAFIVEVVETRFAAKSQRKFAILKISDGLLHYELPIWPELYEQKSHLLRDNQLLYAVLQVDKKEEPLKLSCRWLDDLTRVDEAMVEACDQAFDKAKQMSQRSFGAKKAAQDSEKSVTKPKVNQAIPVSQTLIISLNADAARHSEVVQLKEIFTAYRGSIPVSIDFCVEERAFATLQIPANWGVSDSQEVLQKLQGVKSLVKAGFVINT